jgi:hypothetical protein
VRAATPCTTLGVPEFSPGRAYGDSLGASLEGRADRMRVLLVSLLPLGKGEGGVPVDSSALKASRHLPDAPKLTCKFSDLRVWNAPGAAGHPCDPRHEDQEGLQGRGHERDLELQIPISVDRAARRGSKRAVRGIPGGMFHFWGLAGRLEADLVHS